MKNNEALKKHHFWILFGLVPFLVMIAVLVVSSSVGGEIAKKDGEIKTATSDIAKKTNPKSEGLIAAMDKSIATVEGASSALWKGSWEPQKSLYVWPDAKMFKEIEKMKLKFGDKIPNDRDQYEKFKEKEVYYATYQKMAARVAPTQFADGWEKILRHVVSPFSDVKLTSEQIWLLLEDIWVQDSMLSAIESVNAQMSEFKRVPFKRGAEVIDDPEGKPKGSPQRRKFKSRTWEIELEVVAKNGKQILTGKLINTTDRLQLMGLGNTMILKVWLAPGKDVQPFEFKIGSEFMPGQGAMRLVKDKDGEREVPANVLDVVETPDHTIAVADPEIVRVEQVFDSRTVPIRLIQAMQLGFPDSRNAAVPGTTTPIALKKPLWEKDDPAAPPAEAAQGGPGGPGPVGGSGTGKPTGMPGGFGAGGKSEGTAATPFGGGTVTSVVDGNKKRYLDVSPQVRRMPVGIVVVVDQTYLQDVLLAFANSPLRFQITQVNWSRYRGSLGTENKGSTGSAGDGGVVQSGRGNLSGDFMPSGPKGPPGGRMPGPGGLVGPTAPPGGAGSTPLPPGGQQPGGFGPGAFGLGAGGIPSTVSESQLTSGLIQLSVYGVVSLYTSPDGPPADGSTGSKDPKDKDPKDKDPKDKDPKDKDPKNDPMPVDPKTPKSRVRRTRECAR